MHFTLQLQYSYALLERLFSKLFIMFIIFHSVGNFKSYMHAWLGSLVRQYIDC